MSSSRYSLLSQKEQGDQSEACHTDARPVYSTQSPVRRLYVFLIMSIFINIGQFAVPFINSLSKETLVEEAEHVNPEPSALVGLVRNISTPFASPSGFHGLDHENQSAFNNIWEQPDFDTNRFTVAIDIAWAAEQGLPTTQPWPWDENKGIYAVRGMHLLHCTKTIHQTLDELRYGRERTWSWGHVEHCVHQLREETMCNAADDLVYTGRLHGQESADVPIPGMGQTRMCKDWSQLYEWVTERSACFWAIPATGPDFHESERYKFCPDGKVHW